MCAGAQRRFLVRRRMQSRERMPSRKRRESIMSRFSRSPRTIFDHDDVAPEPGGGAVFGFLAFPALVLASAVASLVGMG